MKRAALWIASAAALASVACGASKDSSSTSASALTVDGTLAGMTISGSSVYAVGSNGRRFAAPVAANGQFSIRLPTGSSYRLLLVQSSTPAMPVRGHVTFAAGASRTSWLGANAATTLHLGLVQPSQVKTGGLQPMSEVGDTSGDADEAEVEDETTEGDDDGRVCDGTAGGVDDKELVGANEPGEDLKDHDVDHADDDSDDEGEDVGKAACAP